MHPHFEGKVPCGIDGCSSTPASYEGLRQHMHRYHRELLNESTIPGVTVAVTDDNNESYQSTSCNLMEVDQIIVNPPSISLPPEMPARLGAQFILQTRDGRKLTQVATNGIIQMYYF